ncbi:MAG: ATP-dependent RNA helicase DbpA [Dokdonella sp.]
MSSSTPEFTSLPLSTALLQGLDVLAYTTMTPVQSATLPAMLDGNDVIAQARTGSGKTVAFALDLLARIGATQATGDASVQALVLCPTRELADQVSKEIRALARFIPNIKLLTLCGGISLRPQVASLAHPPHIVVGTPGRIQELIDTGNLQLDAARVLVLDEADRMLDMGFEDAISAIVTRLPPSTQRQTLMFSATIPKSIRAISRRFQRAPQEFTIDAAQASDDIEQVFYEVAASRKLDSLVALLLQHAPESALVFCNTKRDTDEVAAELEKRGFAALALHGDLDQREREEMLVRFANRSCNVLVATDLAARGLDIKELAAVISYDIASDPDAHLHRIGRTGRAGQTGIAICLCEPAEMPRALAIEAQHGRLRWQTLALSDTRASKPPAPNVRTLCIDGGRQDKLRPGDILGALTGTAGLGGDAVGKIDIFATRAYVAIKRDVIDQALRSLRKDGIKGRKFRVRLIG